jgi:hypothetical protein
MLKKFLVGLVVLCGSSVANAALLVNYSFSGTNGASSWTPTAGDYGSTGGSPSSYASILTAGAFTNVGGNGNGIPGAINTSGNTSAWRTGSTGATAIQTLPNYSRYNEFTLAPITPAIGDGVVTIDSMSFKMGKTTAGNGNRISVEVQHRPSSSASWSTLGIRQSLATNALSNYSINFATPILIDKNSSVGAFRFVWSRTNVTGGSNSGQAAIDDISLFGSFGAPTFVPEPASLAVFGSLAAFGLMGRFRRK